MSDARDLTAEGVSARFDPLCGFVASLTVTDGGREIAPLHHAPWVGSGEAMPEGIAPHLGGLRGDFFCAPFAGHEESSPMHGWPANETWEIAETTGAALSAVLPKKVQGARLTKALSLRDGHPFLYQRHVFEGGTGEVTAANHAMLSVPGGAHIRTSPKRIWETPANPQESDPSRGRSALRYPARAMDPARFPGVEGTVDLTRYPWAPEHEDFAMGLEASESPLGWTAVTRIGRGDLYLSLRNPRAVPMTMLWHSDGGRDYAPWSGRHRGCLGVEEGAASSMLALSDAAGLAGRGAVALGRRAEMRHVIGAIDWPSETPVATVTMDGNSLTVTGEDGTERRVPVDAEFLEGE